MRRRNFLRWSSLLGFTGLLPAAQLIANDEPSSGTTKLSDRAYWVKLLDQIAGPVLSNMSKGLLKHNMPMEVSPTWDGRPKDVGYMEAFGRLMAGIAPFLALPDDNTEEGKIRKRLRTDALGSFANAVDPQSADFLFWGDGKTAQPLVDAAYIAQAFLYAPDALWQPLSKSAKAQYVQQFRNLRKIKPFNSNWLLFAAIIESFLLSIGEEIDAPRIDNAIDKLTQWYVGDGWYSDGDKFHFDHYNGYVMHPMMTEVLRVNIKQGRRKQQEFDIAYKRMQRYASFQERYISPEGTYPVFGRSSTYRMGAFWPLAKLSLDNALPEGVSAAQVRCALTAVMRRMFIPGTFTKNGYLTLGLIGPDQNNIADYYSNTGSMYITSMVFMPLGLPATAAFWTAPFTDWTQRKAWSGQPFPKDYAVDY